MGTILYPKFKKYLLWGPTVIFILFLLCSCEQITNREDADIAVQDYISEHWPSSDFQLESFTYPLGSSHDFYYQVISETSLDTWFVVCYNSETKVCWDGYENGMELTQNGTHTAERLSEDYADRIDDLLNTEGYDSSFTQVIYDSSFLAQAWESGVVLLDMDFDTNIDLGWEIWIQLDIDGNGPVNKDRIKKETEKIHEIILHANYQFVNCRFDITWINESNDRERISTITMDALGNYLDT